MSISLDPSMQLSRYFTLGDLTTTSQGVDNTPDTQSLDNLKRLAQILDILYDTIGPFRVTSAYRSPEVNSLIGGSDTSLHMRGMAADLVPYNDSAKDYFLKILRNSIFSQLGEVVDESDEKGVVHVTLPAPGNYSAAKYLKNGNYLRYSSSEVAALQAGQSPETESSYGLEAPSLSPTTLIAVGALVVIVALLILEQPKTA